MTHSLSAKIWRTKNMNVNTTINYNGIHYTNDNNAIIIGDSGLLLTTSDAGATWSQHPDFDKSSGNIQNIVFETESTGYINTAFSVMKTTDGGQTWSLSSPSAHINYIGIHEGSMYNYGDAGFGSFILSIHSVEFDTFSYHQGYYPISYLERAKYLGDSTVLIIQDTGRIYYSSDLGSTLVEVFSPADYNFTNTHSQSIEFLTDKIGFVTYDKNLFVSTTDGGLTWSIDTSQNISNIIEPTTGVVNLVAGDMYKCTPRVSFFFREYLIEKYDSTLSKWEVIQRGEDFFGTERYLNKGKMHGTKNILATPLNGQLLYSREASLSIANHTLKVQNFGMYPNPSSGNVILHLDNEEVISEVRVTDITGAIHHSNTTMSTIGPYSLHLTHPGTYLVTVVSDVGISYTRRLIVR
jgi:hypothetical protein